MEIAGASAVILGEWVCMVTVHACVEILTPFMVSLYMLAKHIVEPHTNASLAFAQWLGQTKTIQSQTRPC